MRDISCETARTYEIKKTHTAIILLKDLCLAIKMHASLGLMECRCMQWRRAIQILHVDNGGGVPK